jgi:hypothetical protein
LPQPRHSRPPAWEWSFVEDGALALDPDRLWDEPERPERGKLKRRRGSATVLAMSAPPAPGRAARHRRRSGQREVRRRQLAVLVAIAAVALGTLLVTAFGGGGDNPSLAAPRPANAARLLPAGPPTPQVVARLGGLQLVLPVNQRRLTAIGYYGGADGALALSPVGTQGNAGLLKRLVHLVVGGGSGSPRWYLLPGGQGPATSALAVGAAPGTDVYSPVNGTIVGIAKVVVNGEPFGQRIDVQPANAPSLVVSISRLQADSSLKVGTIVTAAASKLGEVLDFSQVEHQALARYTNDAGNHVLVEVHPVATLLVR